MKRERRLKTPSRKRFIKVRTLRKSFDDDDDDRSEALDCGGGLEEKANSE